MSTRTDPNAVFARASPVGVGLADGYGRVVVSGAIHGSSDEHGGFLERTKLVRWSNGW